MKRKKKIPRKVGAPLHIYSPPAVFFFFYPSSLHHLSSHISHCACISVFFVLFQFESLQLLSTFQFSHRFFFFFSYSSRSADGEEWASWRSLPTVADRQTSGIPNLTCRPFLFFSLLAAFTIFLNTQIQAIHIEPPHTADVIPLSQLVYLYSSRRSSGNQLEK